MLPDSNDEFSTPNYGLTTTPSKEWALVLEGGSGCAKVEGKEDSVSVTGTRGCCKKGQTQPDVRVLRPITYYGDFGVDGRLRWGVGDEVVVGEAFTIVGNRKKLAKDTEGTVLEFNAEGAAKIAFRKIPHALMLVLSCLDDAGLRREFDAHVDLEDKGERRMSKAGLAKFMGAKGLAHGEAEVERVMKRVDTNGDFEIDFLEFCGLARANSDLELVLRSQKLECILASFFPSGTKLEDIGKMGRAQFSDIVNLSQPAMVQLLVGLATQVAAVGKAQDGAGGGKFTGELKGGPLDDFYKGVTGVCGEPDADIEKGESSKCPNPLFSPPPFVRGAPLP